MLKSRLAKSNGTSSDITAENKRRENLYKYLLSTNGAPPLLYGLPKIHKPPKFPLRPIVDYNPSPLRNLSSFLNKSLQPLSGNLNSHLRNSMDLKEKLKDTKLDVDESLVSFDVTALYSSIPLDLALRICSLYISFDLEFTVRTGLSHSDFMNFLSLCLLNTYFFYQDKFYRQIKGLPMGAAISVTVANLVMEFHELYAFQLSPQMETKFFYRYFDDIACGCKTSLIPTLLSHLNSIHPDIQFTQELEIDGSLPFLDTKISRKPDGYLSFSVFRKQTHSGRYLHFSSSNPISHKKSVVASLFHRALRVCSNNEIYNSERLVIIKELSQNGYPSDFILKSERETIRKHQLNKESFQETRTDEGIIARLGFPYIRQYSEQVARICANFDLKIVFKPINNLGSIWGSLKTKLPVHSFTDAIYKISCLDCEAVYIGESNNFGRRCTEHSADVRLLRVKNSALAEHSNSLGHKFDFDNATILANDRYYLTRKLSESFFIQTSTSSINKHPGSLPPSYLTSDIFKFVS
jgi:hypothetical protein